MSEDVMQVYAPVALAQGTPTATPAAGVTVDERVRLGFLWNGKPNADVALEAIRTRAAHDRSHWVIESVVKGGMPTPADELVQLERHTDAVIAASAD